MVLYPISCNCLEFYIKEMSTSNSNPGVGDDTRVVYWDLCPGNPAPTPVVSVKIGDHYYHGLYDIGASVSAISLLYIKKL